MEPKPISPLMTIPGAIIIAGAIIAMAIIWNKKMPVQPAVSPTQNQSQQINLIPISSEDHILGNPNAPITIVEYSDPSCPFCKMFHPTILKIMDTYGGEGKVAWVYRHFPLDKPGTGSGGGILHPNAGHEAQALECAGALGGVDTFWKYTNRLYDITPSVTPQTPTGLDQKQLPEIAKFVGLDPISFNECLTSGRFKDKVESQYQGGLSAGVSGTPYNIVVLSKPADKSLDDVVSKMNLELQLPPGSIFISNDRTKVSMSGALPFESFKTLIEAVLANK